MARFASKAARDKRICHGEIARMREEIRGRAFFFFPKISLVKKNVNKTVKTPKKAEAKRVENSLSPKSFTGITERYA